MLVHGRNGTDDRAVRKVLRLLEIVKSRSKEGIVEPTVYPTLAKKFIGALKMERGRFQEFIRETVRAASNLNEKSGFPPSGVNLALGKGGSPVRFDPNDIKLLASAYQATLPKRDNPAETAELLDRYGTDPRDTRKPKVLEPRPKEPDQITRDASQSSGKQERAAPPPKMLSLGWWHLLVMQEGSSVNPEGLETIRKASRRKGLTNIYFVGSKKALRSLAEAFPTASLVHVENSANAEALKSSPLVDVLDLRQHPDEESNPTLRIR